MVAGSVLAFAPAVALASQPARVTLDSTAHPYERVLAITNGGDRPVDAYADVRVLRLELVVPETQPASTDVGRPSPRRVRPVRCASPGAPRSPSSDDRWVRLLPGETHREMVDLRFYCTGRARDVLERGATVLARYGFPRLSRAASRGGRGGLTRAEDGSHVGPPVIDLPASSQAPAPAPRAPGEVVVEMPDLARVGFAAAVRPRVRVLGPRRRILLRPDLWSFAVRGPLGAVECAIARDIVSPRRERYRMTGRRGQSEARLTLREYCPPRTFEVPGIYEVTPRLDAIYDGHDRDTHAWTGTVLGDVVVLRVVGRGYVVVPPRGESGPRAPRPAWMSGSSDGGGLRDGATP